MLQVFPQCQHTEESFPFMCVHVRSLYFSLQVPVHSCYRSRSQLRRRIESVSHLGGFRSYWLASLGQRMHSSPDTCGSGTWRSNAPLSRKKQKSTASPQPWPCNEGLRSFSCTCVVCFAVATRCLLARRLTLFARVCESICCAAGIRFHCQ